MPISRARSQLFQLADRVRSGDDTVVVLEQRGGKESVVLVREARLAYLEAKASEADKARTKPFRLQGSVKLLLPPEALEAALRDIRKGWSRAEPLAAVSRRPRRS